MIITKKDWADYIGFVQSMVIQEPVEDYTMLRAGVEMAEEYFEYRLEPSIDELGDFTFWFAYWSYSLDFQLVDTEKIDIDIVNELKLMKDFLGDIKRLYRDKDRSKLTTLKWRLPSIQAWIEDQLIFTFNSQYTFKDLIDSNKAKLIKRNK